MSEKPAEGDPEIKVLADALESKESELMSLRREKEELMKEKEDWQTKALELEQKSGSAFLVSAATTADAQADGADVIGEDGQPIKRMRLGAESEFAMHPPADAERPTRERRQKGTRPPCLICAHERDGTVVHIEDGKAVCAAQADPVHIKLMRLKSSKKPKQGMLFPLYNPGFWIKRLCECGTVNFEPSVELPAEYSTYQCGNCSKEMMDDENLRIAWAEDVAAKKKARWEATKAKAKEGKKEEEVPQASLA
ncbi:hypothetical protein FVE85_3883 [Porphyridium purpureum]|uniref:Uncharacterized protein n=1 Tax=Porphyridium purpureum TaxID=35688 RepID=A0A5J4YRK2_PORPP|nr:hypothetical protein FVE85_3883 [Porphyridium purpureum]|eukprot:POR5785..scf229_5